jgi:hypothetical protein
MRRYGCFLDKVKHMKGRQQTLYRLVVIISALVVLVMIGKDHVRAGLEQQQSSAKMVLVQ